MQFDRFAAWGLSRDIRRLRKERSVSSNNHNQFFTIPSPTQCKMCSNYHGIELVSAFWRTKEQTESLLARALVESRTAAKCTNMKK